MLFWGLFLLFLGSSLLIQPIGDDWAFLRFFKEAEAWNVEPRLWKHDCILMPRIGHYWRPIEDIVYSYQQRYHPAWFPYLNHILTVSMCFGSIYLMSVIAAGFGFDRKKCLCVFSLCAFFPTNMGTLFSCDGFTQASALFWGVLSACGYLSGCRTGKAIWIAGGFLACFSKETGVLFFVAGPLLHVLRRAYGDKETNLFKLISWSNVGIVAKSAIPIVLFVAVYALNSSMLATWMGKTDETPAIAPAAEAPPPPESGSDSFVGYLAKSHSDHKLSPATFVKNVYILYAAPWFPVDTSSVYYRNWTVLGVSAILSLSGPLLFFMLYKRLKPADRTLFWGLVCIAFLVSLSSLVTRAGEMSSITSNAFLAFALVPLLHANETSLHRSGLACLFVLSTLFTDAHKYSLAYSGGMTAMKMAREIRENTLGNPSRVLLISRDEKELDRAGGAFNSSPYHAFGHGAAAIREYGYEHPGKLDELLIPMGEFSEERVESIVEGNIGCYDCIWIVKDDVVTVINGRGE